MKDFNRQKVLEKILGDAPILSNKRGIIEVGGWERVIYAFYFNRGVPDPELQYDKVANPEPTTPNSTLCEIYSFWDGDPNAQKLVQRLIAEHKIREGDVIYQGPWLMGPNGLTNPPYAARQREQYRFHHSASAFENHFNRICEELGFDIQLINLYEKNSSSNEMGAVAVQVPKRGGRIARAQVPINFVQEDPTLCRTLESITNAYEEVKRVA